MNRYMHTIAMMWALSSQPIFCMEQPLTLYSTITHVERRLPQTIPVLIYDATFQDGTKVMISHVTQGMFKGRTGLEYKDASEQSMRTADTAFLHKLYPACKLNFNESDSRATLYTHLIKTLDAEYLNRNPQELIIFASK